MYKRKASVNQTLNKAKCEFTSNQPQCMEYVHIMYIYLYLSIYILVRHNQYWCLFICVQISSITSKLLVLLLLYSILNSTKHNKHSLLLLKIRSHYNLVIIDMQIILYLLVGHFTFEMSFNTCLAKKQLCNKNWREL